MAKNEREKVIYREEIVKVVGIIKDGNSPTSDEIHDSLGLSIKGSRLVLASARAWIYTEEINSLIHQLNTGKLKGVKPVGTLNGDNKT